MEKAILKTLAYADIFDYPLKINEIHKWLIGRKVTLLQAEKALDKLVKDSRQRRGSPKAAKLKVKSGYYFLPKRVSLVGIRRRREEQSKIYFQKAKILSQLLKIVPWIKLVGISGGLAMGNAGQKDDIDLFIITSKNHLWISRLVALGLLSLAGQRRKIGEKGRKIAGKLCVNTLLEEDRLEQNNKDIYVAHEVLQMKALWQRNGVYSKYLAANEWVFNFLPNWTTNLSSPSSFLSSPRIRGSNKQRVVINWIPAFAGMTMEKIAKWLQLKIMQKPQGMERIEDGALYFHPADCRLQVLSEYKNKLSRL